MVAYACEIKEENFDVIRSENPDFDLDFIVTWLYEHGDGYFVRDEGNPFDCQYIPVTVFNEIYRFEHADPNALFRHIKMIP